MDLTGKTVNGGLKIVKYSDLSSAEIAHLYARTKCYSKKTHDGSISYINTVVTFDTETTSILIDGEKNGYCYLWTMAIRNYVVYGRTLDEFRVFISTFSNALRLNETKRIICYVHNLSFDFQFFHKYFDFVSVFARTKRTPIYAVTESGVEFRCSYMLTLQPLSALAKSIPNYTNSKLTDFDYSLPRNSATPLTEREMLYAALDVVILKDYIEQVELPLNSDKVTKIPLTKTGYVRRECRAALMQNHIKWLRYKERLDSCQPDTDLFTLLCKAYQGGYTHANSKFVDLILDNVKSIDFASSYPTQMICKKFPWKFFKVEIETETEFKDYLKQNACLFEIAFENLKAKSTITILSGSKCEVLEGATVDNGRVYSADYVLTYCTDLDFKNLARFYTWDGYTIGDFYISKYEPLPREIINVVLTEYTNKTTLKGVKGQEREYMIAKGLLNGIYGMCVTNPVNDNIVYNGGEWTSTAPDITKALQEYRDSQSTFLLYQWGVWVSALARYELLQTVADITEISNNVVYCDTDSIKYVDNDSINEYIAEYNRKQTAIFENIAKKYRYTIPQTRKGERAILGVFDCDGVYEQFKTLGAKRYVYTDSDGFHITIAGLSKKEGAAYLQEFEKPFNAFSDGLEIPPEKTGKKEHHYIDDERRFKLIDYKGNIQNVVSPSSVWLGDTGFSLSLSQEFIELFMTVQENHIGTIVNGKTRAELAIGITGYYKRKRGF